MSSALAVLGGAKRRLVGRPRASSELEDTLLPKTLALPIFSSDPISSVAYATEAALAVLVAVSLSARHDVLPISAAVSALLLIVAFSYSQGIKAYENTSGGSYVFARENLGVFPALVAGAALLTDYILTVAVSVAAGVFAITSAAPSLGSHRVLLSLGCILVLTLGNLRGVRESGLMFAFPTYAFLAVMYAMLAVGVGKCTLGTCPTATVPHPLPTGAGALGLFVLLKAFASGSAALTGVESISNGVTAFRHPQSQNASRTLLLMAGSAVTLFLGVSYLAVRMHALPSSSASVLSQIARATFPAGSTGSTMYYLIQAFTLAILVLAANTSYQGFPRLAALLARDGFLPRQFVNLGDRLAYSNGIIVLTAAAAGLVLAFRANVNSLIHLYVIGVFTAFTLAQAGMVRYWLRTRRPGWRWSAALNAVGAASTLVVAVIVIATKFLSGAWMVMIAIPVMIACFYAVRRHYRAVARRLRAKAHAVLARRDVENTVVLYVERLDDATREALWYARTISKGSFVAVHVPFPGSDSGIGPRFFELTGGEPRLEVVSKENEPLEAMLEYVWRFPHGDGSFVTVVIPELFRAPSLLSAVRGTAFRLKLRLLREPDVAVADIPRLAGDSDAQTVEPSRPVCVVPVADVHAASLRAVVYARSLGFRETKAVSFAFDEDDARRVERDWLRFPTGVPLEVVEAPFRDVGQPLLTYLRGITADPEAVAVVVMPELVARGTDRLLHNQRALYLKRLLLFEPRVILTSVPFQLT
ncbi:MAG: APC family permease [Actinobacteria bacterium]|nr:MAG: APC family permease [Actinomycetota bacterium]